MAEIFDKSQVVEMLRGRQGQMSQRDFSNLLKIHETALSAIYAGRVAPSRVVLKFLKLRVKKGPLLYERDRK